GPWAADWCRLRICRSDNAHPSTRRATVIMSTVSRTTAIANILTKATHIVIVQADNPDGDSLASALALEQILHDLGKQPFLYCGIDIPKHLRHLPGWDRVEKDLPHNFDAAILVDCSSRNLLEVADNNGQLQWL